MKKLSKTEIMKQEINYDLQMVKIWRDRQRNSITPKEVQLCAGAVLRSIYRAEAKEEMIISLGYDVLYNDERDEVIAVHGTKFDE